MSGEPGVPPGSLGAEPQDLSQCTPRKVHAKVNGEGQRREQRAIAAAASDASDAQHILSSASAPAPQDLGGSLQRL